MPTEDLYKHEIVLRGAHEAKLNGYKTTVPCETKCLDVPAFCGCVTSFKPAGYTEAGEDGVVREVWVQDDFKFNKHLPPL